jgi:uncharacterized protein with HEPN domain
MQEAVLRRILVVGDAASRLSPETLAKFSAIPFRKMAAMRHRVVHDYGHIDFEIVWGGAMVHLRPVRMELSSFWQR